MSSANTSEDSSYRFKVVMRFTASPLYDLNENQNPWHTQAKPASSATEQNAQSLSSLQFLTLTLSVPPGNIPKDGVAGTDRVMVMDRSEYIDCVIMSVAKMALLLDYDMDRVFEVLYSVIKMNTNYDTT